MSHLRTSGKDCISCVGPIWLFSNAHIDRGVHRRTGESLSLSLPLTTHLTLHPCSLSPYTQFPTPHDTPSSLHEHIFDPGACTTEQKGPLSPSPLMISLFPLIVPYVEQPHIMYIVYLVNNTPRTSCRTLHIRVQQLLSPLPQRKVHPIIYYGHKKRNWCCIITIYTYIVGLYKRNEGKGPRMRGTVCSLSEMMGTTLAEHGRTVIGGIDGDGRVGGQIGTTVNDNGRRSDHDLEISDVIYW
jgi:hypothetical protein